MKWRQLAKITQLPSLISSASKQLMSLLNLHGQYHLDDESQSKNKMNRKIRFPLKMGDGFNARILDDLRLHYDHQEVVDYFLDKKLYEWLYDRYYFNLANEVDALFKSYSTADNNRIRVLNAQESEQLQQKLCAILKVKWQPEQKVDINERNRFNDREDRLQQLLEDQEAREHVELVACNQFELEKLLRSHATPIFLFAEDEDNPPEFHIPVFYPNLRLKSGRGLIDVKFDHKPDGIILENIRAIYEDVREDSSLIESFTENPISGVIDAFSGAVDAVCDLLRYKTDTDETPQQESIVYHAIDRKQYNEEKNSILEVRTHIIRYMDAGFPVLLLKTFEEDKADDIIASVSYGRKVLEWSVRGFADKTNGVFKDGQSLADTLNYFMLHKDDLKRSVFVLKDSQELIKENMNAARLKVLAQMINEGILEDTNIVIISPIIVIPDVLEHFISVIDMGHLSQREIRDIINTFCDQQQLDRLEEELAEELSIAFKGLSEFEIINVLALALSGDNEIDRQDMSLIMEQKKQLIIKSGILEMIDTQETSNNIGGLDQLKKWLQRKASVFNNIKKAASFGVDVPKGVLIAGMPGCGKSLCAKASAQMLNVPLLRMDMGRLMGKYVGESEANMHKAIAMAEAIAPCVLWIDELEKVFTGIGSEGNGTEVTTRLFGIFLTWLQEKENLVFVVATANNITKMPPEILRKGRFDEIFYIDLPNEVERKSILQIHIARRRPADLEHMDLDALVAATAGYSGADIEGVIKESIETVFADGGTELTTQDILNTIKETYSLKETMKDSMDNLSQLYREHKFKNASTK